MKKIAGATTHCPGETPERVKEDVVARDDAATIAEHVPDGLVRHVVFVPFQPCGPYKPNIRIPFQLRKTTMSRKGKGELAHLE